MVELSIEQINEILKTTGYQIQKMEDHRFVGLYDNESHLCDTYHRVDLSKIITDILKSSCDYNFQAGQNSIRSEIKKTLGIQ